MLLAVALAAVSWSVLDVVDPITDAKRAIRSLVSEGGTMVFKCDDNGPGSVYIALIAQGYMGNGRRPVILRFDKDEPSSKIWSYADRTAVLSNSILFRRELDGFYNRLRTASTLTARLERFDGQAVDLQFDLTGAADQLDQVYQGCGDTPPKPPKR